jgi:pyridoxamine 5'-phosphate oxidase
MSNKISDLRQNYSHSQLARPDLTDDPIDFFKKWFDEALNAEIIEPNAMTLATVNAEGVPSARIVLLKEISPTGIVFYTNYTSDKAQDIAIHPQVSVVFLWQEIERQVRINGTAQKISRTRTEAYAHSRPRASQIGAWTSPQSQVITDRDILESNEKELIERFKDIDVIPVPPHWGGYEITIDQIEFWQGRPSRLHDRFKYTKVDGAWKVDRLAP